MLEWKDQSAVQSVCTIEASLWQSSQSLLFGSILGPLPCCLQRKILECIIGPRAKAQTH
jgi:hypothetical protein